MGLVFLFSKVEICSLVNSRTYMGIPVPSAGTWATRRDSARRCSWCSRSGRVALWCGTRPRTLASTPSQCIRNSKLIFVVFRNRALQLWYKICVIRRRLTLFCFVFFEVFLLVSRLQRHVTYNLSEEQVFFQRASCEGVYLHLYICLYWLRSHPQVKHYHIKKDPEGNYYLSQNIKCKTIPELIYRHQHNPGGICARLRPPTLGRTAPATAGLSHGRGLLLLGCASSWINFVLGRINRLRLWKG